MQLRNTMRTQATASTKKLLEIDSAIAQWDPVRGGQEKKVSCRINFRKHHRNILISQVFFVNDYNRGWVAAVQSFTG